MANVKNRINTPKNATAKKRSRKNNQTSTGTIPNKDSLSDVVMKRPSNLKLLTPDEKVQYLLQNGHLIKDIFIKTPPRNDVVIRANLMTRSGKIRKKSKSHIKLFNNILKSELLITDRELNNKKISVTTSVNNNNDTKTSDQNKTNGPSISTRVNINKNALRKNTKQDKLNKDNVKKVKDNIEIVKKKNLATSKSKSTKGVNLKLPTYECDHCKGKFSYKHSLRKHMYRHLNINPYPCARCSKSFSIRPKLLEHMKVQHPDVDNSNHYICQFCEKLFLLKKNLCLHLATHVTKENYKCIYCSKTFSQQMQLIDHEKQHLVTGKFQCTICNMNYSCRNRLALHVKSHLKIKEYICQYCGKEFLRPNSLRRHVQICHGGHRIQCPICKKKLKGHLTEHLRTHEKQRPHECPDCGQRFTQSTQLNVHRRAHTGARPYPCRICGRPFTHSNALMLHIRRHTGEKPFPCAMCPLSFSQLPHMKAHMRNIHGKNNPYKCSKCQQFFKWKVELENHVKTCTVGDKELSFEEKIQASITVDDAEIESVMSLSRMRFLLALLLTMIASSEKLKYLGFNKRLIDDLLIESLEAMGQTPCKDETLSQLKRLKTNIAMLLEKTIPKHQMEKFRKENKTTEELLELLTDEKKKE